MMIFIWHKKRTRTKNETSRDYENEWIFVYISPSPLPSPLFPLPFPIKKDLPKTRQKIKWVCVPPQLFFLRSWTFGSTIYSYIRPTNPTQNSSVVPSATILLWSPGLWLSRRFSSWKPLLMSIPMFRLQNWIVFPPQLKFWWNIH